MADHTQWLVGNRVVQLAQRWRIALMMPACDNSFYVGQEASNSHYGQCVGHELVTASRRLLPLSRKREETWIGGLSMRGYGAGNGLQYHGTFGGTVALSAVLVTDRAIRSSDGVEWAVGRRRYSTAAFGDLDRRRGATRTSRR